MTSVGDPLVGQLLDGRYQITSAARPRRHGHRLPRHRHPADPNRRRQGDAHRAGRRRRVRPQVRPGGAVRGPSSPTPTWCRCSTRATTTAAPYIVMEYVEGRTLRDVLNHEAPLPPERALEIIEPVIAALAAAHEAGLVHRDVKPENVLINDRGQVKVVDFGLAKAISAQTSTATQGLLIGTVSYLPPELVLSGRPVPAPTSTAPACVLFEMLTGRKPHVGDTPIQVAYAHVHNDVPPPSQFRDRRAHPALSGCPGGRRDRPQPRRPAARRQGLPLPGTPSPSRPAGRAGRRPRPDPGPQRAAALGSVGSAAARGGSELRDHPAGASCRRRTGQPAPDRPPAWPDADLTHLPGRAPTRRAVGRRPRRSGAPPGPARLRRAAGRSPGAGVAAAATRLADRAAGADADRDGRPRRLVSHRGAVHRDSRP